jgi:hypothetical protein
MPSRPRKTPAPVTTGAARRTEEPDALAAAPPTPRAAKPKPAATPAAGTRKVTTRTPRKAAAVAPTPPAAPAPVVEETVEAPPAAARKIQRSFHVDIDVLDNARAAVTYLAAYVPEAGVQSLSDLVNPGLFQMTKVLQDKYNNGQPFRRVARMQAGRPPKRT